MHWQHIVTHFQCITNTLHRDHRCLQSSVAEIVNMFVLAEQQCCMGCVCIASHWQCIRWKRVVTPNSLPWIIAIRSHWSHHKKSQMLDRGFRVTQKQGKSKSCVVNLKWFVCFCCLQCLVLRCLHRYWRCFFKQYLSPIVYCSVKTWSEKLQLCYVMMSYCGTDIPLSYQFSHLFVWPFSPVYSKASWSIWHMGERPYLLPNRVW